MDKEARDGLFPMVAAFVLAAGMIMAVFVFVRQSP